ncbi:MAG: bifunctional diguanylate cyclase/phosphodiesterase [Oscillospiraceae bacterium]|nr:bifunctional diguanylate cyclase/phosphodiesterase [Oscillospiraceae bacterium]
MSLIVIVLEIWMIVRMLNQYFSGQLPKPFSYYFSNYLIFYIVLLSSGIFMLVCALLHIRGKLKRRWIGTLAKWLFAGISLYFGIRISIGDYTKGEQILTFLTMELFVMCLFVWRPFVGFLILTLTYLFYVSRISGIAPVSGAYSVLSKLSEYTPEEAYEKLQAIRETRGLSQATQINLFTMWLSTLIISFSNYHKTLTQALKDEHLEEVNAYLNKISVNDELTGIHNMVFFRSEAEKLLGYITTDKENIVFLYFDIENFKYYNEKYGFHEGNELLRKVAKMIDSAFTGSLVSRLSDDHFVVLTRYDGCDEIIRTLGAKIHEFQREVHLELKCGAYRPMQEEETIDPSVACDRARFACNSIKKRYEQTFQMYDKTLEDRFHLKQYIINSIDTAIESGYIKVFYQPVVNTADRSIVGLEALARWQDPNYGLLPPGVFIEILEEHRLIHKLDQCIIQQVCRDYREAADKGLAFAPVSLNFSRLDFELCDIVGYFEEKAREYGVPQEYLDVEITESALSDQQNLLQAAMRRLRQDGYKVWLDDFGSGYSSLNFLKDYQFDVLKIDMKFLSGFSDNLKTRPILQNIVNLTQQLDMVSLTEGVETPEQFDFLAKIGCSRAQGYLFSKPVPIADLRERIDKGELHVNARYTAISA